MVLPGVRTDPRTPGGMPDSGNVNPGGPIPSVPQATRQPNMGAGAGEPDPKKIEEMFTQYTTGQITREDLLNFLHGASEGQGGILGLLEGIGQESEQSGSQPVGSPGSIPPQPQPQPAAAANGKAISPGAASVPIPPLEEPLDKRHQQISMMLQGYGLGPADADQMASILNPHTAFHTREWSEDEGLWMDMYDPDPAGGDQPESGGIAWDPTVRTAAGEPQGDQGTAAAEMAAQAGLGSTLGSTGGGYVTRDGVVSYIGDTSVMPEGGGGAALRQLGGDTTFSGYEAAYQEPVDAPWGHSDIGVMPDYSQEGGAFGGGAVETAQTGKPTQGADGKWYLNGREIKRTSTTQPDVSGGPLASPLPPVLPDIAQIQPPEIGDTNAVGQEWDGTNWVTPKAAVDYSGTFGDVMTDPSQLGTFLETNNPAFAKTPTGQFISGGGNYSAFAGGSWELPTSKEDQSLMGKLWGWLRDTPQSPEAAMGMAKVMPVQDEASGEWFPTEKSLNDYKKWVADKGTYYGGGTTTFSHWEDPTTKKRVAANTPGAVGVGKNMVGVDVTVKGVGNTTKTETFYFPDDHQLDQIRASITEDGWLPWDEEGNPWPKGSKEGFLPGYGPNGWIKKTAQPKIIIPKADPKDVVKLGDTLPDGWTFVETGGGLMGEEPVFVPVNDETGETAIDNGDGTFTLPSDKDGVTPPVDQDKDPAAATTTEPGFGPTMTDLDLRGTGTYTMMDDFLQQIETGNITGDAAGAGLTGVLANAVAVLEVQKSKKNVAADQRMADVVMNSLDRAAVTARADADRKLQSGAAIGEIEGSLTLANRAEKNKAAMEQAKLSGIIPTLDDDGNFVTGTDADAQTLAARTVTMTETEKEAQRNQNMSQLFGTWMAGDPTTAIETLEKQKFGLTKAITEAEMSGKIPTGYGTGETLAAKRMAWERDVAQRNSITAQREAINRTESIKLDAQIANNRRILDDRIQTGQLAEAVEARKDSTFLAKQKLDIEREKMKLDTLTALANPATYLFAVRYGLLEQIGGAMGISWGDDVITSADLPRMVEPGTFPSMTDFQNATPVEREIMLAEVASSGGFTTDEAVRMIMEGAPGGRDIRRTSLVGVSR